MKALQNLRQILKTISQDVEVLPAVGGAVEDLERPDFEEREDQALNEEEKVFETIFERDPSGPPPPVPSCAAAGAHRATAYRFLDPAVKANVSRLQKGELVASHATFRQPVKIRFPRPAYWQEGE